MKECRLYDIAKVIRSKNSGPFQITLDVLFEDGETYRKIRESGIISREKVAALYRMEPERIQDIVFFDKALGFKITYDRDISSAPAATAMFTGRSSTDLWRSCG